VRKSRNLLGSVIYIFAKHTTGSFDGKAKNISVLKINSFKNQFEILLRKLEQNNYLPKKMATGGYLVSCFALANMDLYKIRPNPCTHQIPTPGYRLWEIYLIVYRPMFRCVTPKKFNGTLKIRNAIHLCEIISITNPHTRLNTSETTQMLWMLLLRPNVLPHGRPRRVHS